MTLPPLVPSGAASVAVTSCYYLQDIAVRVWGVKAAREVGFLCQCGFSGRCHPAARCDRGPTTFRVLSLGELIFPAALAVLSSESRIDIGEQWLGVDTQARLLESNSYSAICMYT